LEQLTRAAELQQRWMDGIGLARTTAALSDVLARSSRPEEALRMLADSVGRNLETGSQFGLQHNRVALLALLEVLDGPLAASARQLAQRVEEAVQDHSGGRP
jgi:signal transduction histidine kinase